MPYLRRLSERHQITIPPSILAQAGIPEDTLFSIEVDRKRVILEPKAIAPQDLSQEDWKLLDRLVKKQSKAHRFKEYKNPQKAKKHFQK